MRRCRLRRSTDPLVKRVIILSQARSGSTLLQRILHCCIPEANINGENHNFWEHISNSYYAWKKTCERPEAARSYTREDLFKPCWWNEYKLNDLLKSYRKLFDDMYKAQNHKLVGFKEVRVPQNPDALHKYISFFREMFPNCVIIFTYRNLDQIVKSGWWSESDRQHLGKMETLLKNYARQHPDYVYILNYNELSNINKMRNLFAFLKEPFHEQIYHSVIQKVYK